MGGYCQPCLFAFELTSLTKVNSANCIYALLEGKQADYLQSVILRIIRITIAIACVGHPII